MRRVYETNVFGPVRVLHAFIPLLERSPAPVVVNVSSGVGSLGLASDPESPLSEANYPVYASSKAALNMLTIRYAAAFPSMCINSVDPGFTATDFNEHRGTQTVEHGAHLGQVAGMGEDVTLGRCACWCGWRRGGSRAAEPRGAGAGAGEDADDYE